MFLSLLLRILSPLVQGMKANRRRQFEALPKVDVDILFVGVSITEGGLWNEWLPEFTSANRGISGETSAEVAARLDSLPASAKFVFLLIGTNDLTMAVKEDAIVANVNTIISEFKTLYPAAHIVIQSVMPRKANYRERIEALNARYLRVAREQEVEYLDLWPVLIDGKGDIDAALSADRLHLNGQGYERWVGVLRAYLAGK